MGLFSKVKSTKEKKQLQDLLAFIVKGTQEAGRANVPSTLATQIEKLEPGLISPSAGATVDVAGNIAVYATSKGISAVLGEGAASAPAATPAAASAFKLEEGIEMPVSKRGGIKADIYPFAQMKPGHSFFVPATEDKPNPAKTLASTCSSASKRHADKGHKFVVRKIAGADGKITGARCFCVPVEKEAAAA